MNVELIELTDEEQDWILVTAIDNSSGSSSHENVLSTRAFFMIVKKTMML